MTKGFFLLFFLFSCIVASAQTFEFNENCRKAYNAIIALRLNEGNNWIALEKKQNPNNLITLYLENYSEFLTIYTADTREVYEKLKSNKDLRIEMMKSGDPASPYYLFCAAEMNAQWAAVQLQFGEYLNAVFSIRKAYKFLTENREKFPDFKANRKTLGLLSALIGSVPDKYRWGVNMLGMDGNVEHGLNELSELVEYSKKNDYIFREETITFYAFLLFQLREDKEKAWQVLMDNGFPQSNNLMNVYICAHIGVYGKHNDEALKILENRPTDTAFALFPMISYLTGLSKLNRLEGDADSYFKKFLAEYKGENHIKSAYQKIAWSYLTRGDSANYKHFIEKALKKGEASIEADKQALKEAESKRIPNPGLLRARILFDGSYYEKAAKEMSALSDKKFSSVEEQTEYLYRFARIYHEWDKEDLALDYYSKAIDKGKDLPRYFAANSAFESGRIYEGKGNIEKAQELYNACLAFPEHEYKNGLDQKAKAALNRIEKSANK